MIFLRATVALMLAGLFLACPARAQSIDQVDLLERMSRHVEEHEQALIELRHDIHRHPELSGSEERTAGLVARLLAALGFEVRTGVGGHGVIGILDGSRPGPMVAFRADMDAVRSSAEDPAEYRSTIPGVRHICGHDVHTTIGVGLAEGFSAIQQDLSGSIMLIFQPAEERGTGAKAMLADGAFEIERPDAIFALHTAPYNVGQIATVAGGMMAGRASLSVTIRGTGDLRGAASEVRNAIEEVGTLAPEFSGQIAPEGFILVQLFGGAAISGGETVVRGQIMTAGTEARERARSAVLVAVESLELPDFVLDADYDERWMEGVTNDSELVERSNSAIQALYPAIDIQTVPGAVPAFSEDYGSFQALVPGVMYFLGVNNPEVGTVGMPHSPDYVADDASIGVGTRAMMAAILERLLAD